MTGSLSRQAMRYRWRIFTILSLGYLLVYFHRLCPAVVAVDMMRDLHAGGGLIGLLGSAYFYPYAIMQIPAGLLSDSWGPRRTISLFLVIASGGSILLAFAPATSLALAGRILVGLGVSTLFVCTLKILSQWFQPREFASMTGIFMGLGGFGSFLAAAPLAFVSTWIGWRSSFLLVGGATLLITLLVWLFVRDTPAELDRSEKPLIPATNPAGFCLAESVRTVLATPAFWPVAFWFFFNSGIYFSLIGLWGGPYLLHVHGLSKGDAGTILSLSAVGLMAGSPLVSLLSNRVFRARKPVLVLASVFSLCLTAALAFATASLPVPALYLIFLAIGATTGSAVVVAFTTIKELFPVRIAGTATGLVNLFPFAGGAILQPLLGYILEINGRVAENFTAAGYTKAFFTLFLCAALACGCGFLVRETFGHEDSGN